MRRAARPRFLFTSGIIITFEVKRITFDLKSAKYIKLSRSLFVKELINKSYDFPAQ